jgi:hypothetical protein
MNYFARRFVTWMSFALLIAFSLFHHPAQAGLVSTDEAVAQDHARQDRDRVNAALSRPEVVKQLEAMGVDPKAAQDRVGAMTDEEIASIAGKLDMLPAGGLSNQEWLLVIIGILLLIIIL